MPPTDFVMADHQQQDGSLESGASVAESDSYMSVPPASFGGAISFVSTQKDDCMTSTVKSPVLVLKALASSCTTPWQTAREDDEVILQFLESMPMLKEEFDIHSKIGEGTFSSVYLCSLKGNPEEQFAVKHLVPTSSSCRIENEINCLQTMGGRDHIMSLLTCVRHKDHVALVMPYFKHDRFIDYLHHMTLPEAREYMGALFVALKTVHSHKIVHRDIKPSNFLYNRSTNQFQLVDFGLAHSVQKPKDFVKKDSTKASGGTYPKVEPSSSGVQLTRTNGIIAPPPSYARQLHYRTAARHQRQSSTCSRSKVTGTVTSRNNSGTSKTVNGMKQKLAKEENKVRLCPLRHKMSEVCDVCMGRSHQTAPRAGTPGFRAPEVLLKSPWQTGAVDMWSAGVIFLCILSSRYPFFRAQDDLSALSQIVALLGSKECSRAANEYGKDLVCEPEVLPTDLKALCTALKNSVLKPSDPVHTLSSVSCLFHDEDQVEPPSKRSVSCQLRYEDQLEPPSKRSKLCNCQKPHSRSQESPTHMSRKTAQQRIYNSKNSVESTVEESEINLDSSDSWTKLPQSAYDLLYRLLDFNPLTRITAAESLEHAFLVDQT